MLPETKSSEKRSQSSPPKQRSSVTSNPRVQAEPILSFKLPSTNSTCIVRPWQYRDVPTLASWDVAAISLGYLRDIFSTTDPKKTPFAFVREFLSEEETSTRNNGEAVPESYAITVDGEVVGEIGMDVISRSEAITFPSCEIGYFLKPEVWGRGIATAVVTRFVEWLFDNFQDVSRIDAYVWSSYVPASSRVLVKCGFRKFAHAKKAAWKQKLGWSDNESYELLKEDWEKKKGTWPINTFP